MHGVAPISVIALDLDRIALAPLSEFERARADGVAFVGFSRGWIDDNRIAPAHIEQEIASGAVEFDGDGVIVNGGDALDGIKQTLLGVGAVIGHGAFDGIDHIAGLKAGAIMKADAAGKFELIGEAIIRNRPALRQLLVAPHHFDRCG